MMIDWVRQNINLLTDNLRNLAANDMVLHHFLPHVVKQTDRALLAFQLMSEHQISGVGVVDENGKPEFRWKKMPQSVGNLVKMASWRVDQLSWDTSVRGQLRSTAGTEVVPTASR